MRIFFLTVFILFSVFVIGQTSIHKCPKFKPIYFKHNSDLIDSANYYRLDSIGLLMQSDTNLVLQFNLFQLGYSNDSLKSILTWNRVQKIKNYLINKFKIKIDDDYLTETNSGGPIERFTKEELVNEDKIVFKIKNCP